MKSIKYCLIVGALLCATLILLFIVAKKETVSNPALDYKVKEIESSLTEQGSDENKGDREEENTVSINNTTYPDELAKALRDHDSEDRKEELRQSYYAQRDGADAKMTFHVTNSKGQNVSNASIRVSFIVTDEKHTTREGTTDENGVFIAEGKTAYRVVLMMEKDGYYATLVRHTFGKSRGDYLKDGKWLPWNQTFEVTLKEKHNPIPMYVKNMEIILPKTDGSFGFDFQVGDLVAPHGKGEFADMLFTYIFNKPPAGEQEYYAHMTFEGVSEKDGMILMQFDIPLPNKYPSPNEYPSVYEAPTEGYENQFEMFKRFTMQAELEKSELTEKDYLVFRSRVVTDDNGGIVSANYGKIYFISYGGTPKSPDGGFVKMQYYFNPTPNDRNIEYDPAENLFDKVKFRGMQP